MKKKKIDRAAFEAKINAVEGDGKFPRLLEKMAIVIMIVVTVMMMVSCSSERGTTSCKYVQEHFVGYR